MKEQQLQLVLNLEKEHTPTFTESELNTISLVLSHVQGDEIVNNIHKKINPLIDEEFVAEMYNSVYLKQHCVEEGSHVLPRGKELSLWDNGYMLVIKD